MTNKYFLFNTDKVVIETARQDLRYEFEINSKYTIICGNSGTGKTTLCEVLVRPNYDESCKFRNKSLERFVDRKQSLPSCTIYSKYRFFVMTDAIIPLKLNSGLTWTDWINDNISEDTVICVDEDFTELYDLEFQKSVSMSNPKWIIISRLPLCEIFGEDTSVCVIECDKSSNVNRFKLVDSFLGKTFRMSSTIRLDSPTDQLAYSTMLFNAMDGEKNDDSNL